MQLQCNGKILEVEACLYMTLKKEPIPEQDAAYLFVKEIFFNIHENWKEIRRWLEELGNYSDLGFSDHRKILEIGLNDEQACCEFSLAILAMEIMKFPPEVTEARKDMIIDGIYKELATLDSIEENPSCHLERVQTYLFLSGSTAEESGSALSKEKMLYYFYRNMGIKNKNGWGDIFLASRLEDLLMACIGDNWKIFHKSFVPSRENRNLS